LSGSDGDKRRRWQLDKEKQGELRVQEVGEPREFVVLK
jgi:hypothetical protein